MYIYSGGKINAQDNGLDIDILYTWHIINYAPNTNWLALLIFKSPIDTHIYIYAVELPCCGVCVHVLCMAGPV